MSIVLSDLSFSYPDGRVVLSKLSASFNPGRTGLIGVNGSGKSTLLRIIVGALRPTSGSVTTGGAIGYLPQNLTLDVGATVASLLGIAPVLTAIRAIEGGPAGWRTPTRSSARLPGYLCPASRRSPGRGSRKPR